PRRGEHLRSSPDATGRERRRTAPNSSILPASGSPPSTAAGAASNPAWLSRPGAPSARLPQPGSVSPPPRREAPTLHGGLSAATPPPESRPPTGELSSATTAHLPSAPRAAPPTPNHTIRSEDLLHLAGRPVPKVRSAESRF